MRLSALLAILAGLLLPGAAPARPFTFAAFGDMPYCNPQDPEGCRGGLARIEALIGSINAARPAFSVFLGDTKGGNESCSDAIILDRTGTWLNRIAGARRFGRPVLLVHGDSHFYLLDKPVPEAPNLTRLWSPAGRTSAPCWSPPTRPRLPPSASG